MDGLTQLLDISESTTPTITLWALVLAELTSGCLTVLVGLLYRHIHTESSYSQKLVHSFVMMSMITSLIMLVIGSSIARAFSLVGALSIIRFRSAIKSPLDISFLFFSMAIGMACGTRFYLIAIVGTFIICAILLLLSMIDFAARSIPREHILTIQFPLSSDPEKLLIEPLQNLFDAYHLMQVESVRQGLLTESMYSVLPKPNVSSSQVLEAFSRINDNNKIIYRSAYAGFESP